MNTSSLHWRSGFFGIEILVMVILIAIAGAILGKAAQPTTRASTQPSGATSQPAGSGEALKDAARAATVGARIAQTPDGDQPPADVNQPAPDTDPPDAVPTLDAPDADPASADGLGEILDGIFDGL